MRNNIFNLSLEVLKIKEICNYFDPDNNFTEEQILTIWGDYSNSLYANWMETGNLENHIELAKSTYNYIKNKITKTL